MAWLTGALLYGFIINAFGVVMTWMDKEKAKHHEWRIPERRFMLFSLLGAGPGIYLSCRTFRHKTKHAKFMVGIPAIMAGQLILAAALFFIRI